MENKKPIKILVEEHAALHADEKCNYTEVKEYFNGVEWREPNQEKHWQQLLNSPVKTRQIFRLIEQPVEEKEEQNINQRWETLKQRNIETPFEYNMEENKTPSPTIKEVEQQEETVELDNLSPVWFINGIPHIESPVKVKTGDELTVVTRTLNPECGVKYGDTGTLDLWYDRVNFGDKGESVYWAWAFKKLVPVTLPANWQKNQQPKGEQETAILDAGTSLEHEVFVIERRPVYSTIQAFGDGQKPYDAMTNRLSANYSMETKERGEQESLAAIMNKYDLSNAEENLLLVDVIAWHVSQTTTLQAEIEELKADREKLSFYLTKIVDQEKRCHGNGKKVRQSELFGLIQSLSKEINPSKP